LKRLKKKPGRLLEGLFILKVEKNLPGLAQPLP
jgi:hypothetical protein